MQLSFRQELSGCNNKVAVWMVWSQRGVVLYLNHFLADADNGAMFCPDFLTFEANFNIVQGLKRDF